jgi:hypothetical protein
VSPVHCCRKCGGFNVLQTSPNNRSSRSRRILSTRAIGNKAPSKVCGTLLSCSAAAQRHASACPVQRRNKWICALKAALKECKIHGPSGDPGAVAPPSEVTLVPWEEFKASKASPDADTLDNREPRIPRGEYQFADRNQIVLDQGQDVWGETREMNMTAPKQTARPQQRHGDPRPTAESAFAGQGGQGGPSGLGSAGVPAAAVFAVEDIQ